MASLSSLLGSLSFSKTAVVLLAVGLLAVSDLAQRVRHRPTHLLFAAVFGTLIAVSLLLTVTSFLRPGVQENPHAMALVLVLVIIGWKTLFGPWEAQTKATVLGTFLFWIAFATLARHSSEYRTVTLVAAGSALVPAGIWALLFLKYHCERVSNVLLMFFAGMLSTFPILFYDALVRRGVELQFFLFRITPESFSRTSHVFVSGQVASGGVRTALIAGLVSFLIVGLIEEVSKFWVLSRSGRRIFTSIDDVLQLSIIVAIGFAFAENVINPVYFPGFVRDFLLRDGGPDVLGFFSNVLGRSVLTSMVHIVSTGVAGYFLGLAIFAGPYLAESRAQGRAHRMLARIHTLFGLDETAVFRTEMLIAGLGSAIILHGIFNFLVTIPDLLPGHPGSFGELLGMRPGSPLHWIPLLAVPAMLYVVGGFWLLSCLFLSKESMEERGHLVTREEYVAEPA